MAPSAARSRWGCRRAAVTPAGLDGAGVMARRVGEMAAQRGLSDLVGDALQISVGIATFPCADIQRREDLFARARNALLQARQKGGGVVALS